MERERERETVPTSSRVVDDRVNNNSGSANANRERDSTAMMAADEKLNVS